MEQNILANNTETKLLNVMRAFILTVLCIVIFYPPYLQGLFFEQHQLPTEIIVFALFIIFWGYKWLKQDFRFLKTPIEYTAVGFMAVYLISILVAVHTRSALSEWLKYCMYFAVFLMISEMAENLKIIVIFIWTIVFSAVGVSLIGLNSAMGGTLVSILNKVFSKLGVQGDMFFGLFVGSRINSTIQYPNALASYVMAVFFVVIGLMLAESKLWLKALYGACTYVLFLTLMLTKSRGAQLLFPVAVILFMLVSPRKTRIKAFVHVLFMALPAGGISLVILPYLSVDIVERKAVLLFAVGMLMTVILAVIVEHIGNILQKIHWLVYVGLSVALVGILPFAIVHIINASVPLELSHTLEEADSLKSVVRDIALSPGNYVLRFHAQVTKQKEQPYLYYVSVEGRTGEDIIFEGSTQLAAKTVKEAPEASQENITFSVPADYNMVRVNFINYYSGTGLTLNNAEIIDPVSGNVIHKVILKNKYNLESLIIRFQNIGQEKSGVVRMLFYKDGLKIFKDRWLLGGGGGAWEFLYRQYQSYSYPSSQAHNFPLQLGIETGIIGILVLLALLFFLSSGYIHIYKKHAQKDQDKPQLMFINAAVITAIGALFMHAVIDFDFSESAMLLLFWQLIAILNRQAKDDGVFEGMVKAKGEHKEGGLKLNAVVGILIGMIVLGFSVSLYSAVIMAQKAYASVRENEMEKAVKQIQRAIRLDRTNEKYVIGYNPVSSRDDIKSGLADILFLKANLFQYQAASGTAPTEAEFLLLQQQMKEMTKEINKIEKKANNNLTLTSNLAGYHFQMGQNEKGIEYLNRAIALFPLEPALWHTKINVYYELIRNSFNNGEEEKAYEYLTTGLDIIRDAAEINKNNMNPFTFDANGLEVLQKMQYIYDYWDMNELTQINHIVQYTIPDLDVNLDQVPDQWRSGDIGLVNLTATEQGLQVKASSESYIYALHYLKLEKGKKYRVIAKLDRSMDELKFEIVGLTSKTIFQLDNENRYVADVIIEKEPMSNGNQLRVFVNTDCVFENIFMLEQQ